MRVLQVLQSAELAEVKTLTNIIARGSFFEVLIVDNDLLELLDLSHLTRISLTRLLHPPSRPWVAVEVF